MVALRQEPDRRGGRTRWLRLVRADDADAPLPLVRRDTLPEHADYRDTGCELAPSCLHCPRTHCQYDEARPGTGATLARDREIAALRRRHRIPIDMLAGTYGLTRRSIFRILRDTR